MRPLALHLRNFRAHTTLDVDLTADVCYSITGPNGSGKSSILTAIDFALFGARGEAAEHVNDHGDGSMSVELEFQHNGQIYLVRRQVTRNKTTVDLERANAAAHPDNHTGWEPLTKETAAETGRAIEELLGFTRRTLRASSLLMQGDAGAFCQADPKDRKAILAEVLGLDRYTRLAETVRADRATADQEAQRLTGRLEALGDPDQLEQQATDLGRERDEAKATQDRLAGDLEQHETDAETAAHEAETLREQAARRRELDAEHRAAQERARALRAIDVEAQIAREKADGVITTIVRLDRLAVEHADKTTELGELEHREQVRTQALAERDRLLAEHGRLIAAAERHDHQALAAVDKITRMVNDPAAVCDRCEQHLPDRAKETALASLSAEKDATLAAATDAHQQAAAAAQAVGKITVPAPVDGLADLRARLTEIASAPTDLAAARATLAGYEERLARAESPEHTEALALATLAESAAADALAALPDPEPGAEASAQERALTAQAAAARVRQQATDTRERHLSLGHHLEDLTGRVAQAREFAQEHAAIGVRVAHLQLLERAYGPNGIPLLILENAAIPAIEQEANEVLARLAGRPAQEGWQVELRTQAETKAGGLRDALDVIVHVPHGTRRYENLSGGERTRVAIAVRLGVARLLANRRGADCQLLALDEPDALDDAGKAALLDLIADRAQDYGVVLLISHDADLRDRFDHAIAVGNREPAPVAA